jgi:hypothetical protein
MSKNLQRSFIDDASLCDRLFDFLDVTSPDLNPRQLANVGRELGAPWELASVSTLYLSSYSLPAFA